ncbi:MAG: response regulator [Bacteroidetes bacterium]|nr:response regulator [Bacteroidota bacterium]
MARPLNIFLADDDEDDIDLFAHTLQAIDPAIIFNSAEDGQQALKFLEENDTPDIIFLDLNMPMTDGRKCLQSIKQNPKLKDVPVIMYTTSSFPTDVGDCLSLGALCFITKPTDVIELRSILSTIIKNVHGNIVDAVKQLHTEFGIYC